MRIKSCTLCKKITQSLFKEGRCHGCYEIERSQSIIRETALKFSNFPAFNALIFKKVLSDLSHGRVKREDAKLVVKLGNTLNGACIAQPRTWGEVRELSGKMRIRYSTRLRLRCPILRVAKDLQEAVQLPAEHFLNKNYERTLKGFPEKNREKVHRYFTEVSTCQSMMTTLKLALDLRLFQRFLKEKDLFSPGEEMARSYFKPKKPWAVPTIRHHLGHLNRFYRWSVARGYCTTNPYEGWTPNEVIRACENCGKTRGFRSHNQFFEGCFLQPIFLVEFDQLILNYRAASTYNQHLFELYGKYIRRCDIRDHHLPATKCLMEFLASESIDVIRSWRNIINLSEKFRQIWKGRGSCPFLKIGKMLQELGVLPIRQMEKEIFFDKMLLRCDGETERVLRRYAEKMARRKCAVGGWYGNVRTVFEFYLWISLNEPQFSLFTVPERIGIPYLQSRNDQDRSGIRRKALNRFYRWAKSEKITLMNPFEGIAAPKVARSLVVCSDEQIRKIEAFVKNSNSSAEYAFVLTLVLYWGLSTLELTLSTIDIHENQIWIHLYRRAIGPGRKSHNREQVLKLPLKPDWLAALQSRYIHLWQKKFEQATKSFPYQPLILGRSSRYITNRPLHQNRVCVLFYEASFAATGQRIPPNVVRRTSGHIHTDYGDASRLTKLGWSKSTATDFSFLPRNYFSPIKK